jgi:hypothetical protein
VDDYLPRVKQRAQKRGFFCQRIFLMTQRFTEKARSFTEGMGWNLGKGKIR